MNTYLKKDDSFFNLVNQIYLDSKYKVELKLIRLELRPVGIKA